MRGQSIDNVAGHRASWLHTVACTNELAELKVKDVIRVLRVSRDESVTESCQIRTKLEQTPKRLLIQEAQKC